MRITPGEDADDDAGQDRRHDRDGQQYTRDAAGDALARLDNHKPEPNHDPAQPRAALPPTNLRMSPLSERQSVDLGDAPDSRWIDSGAAISHGWPEGRLVCTRTSRA